VWRARLALDDAALGVALPAPGDERVTVDDERVWRAGDTKLLGVHGGGLGGSAVTVAAHIERHQVDQTTVVVHDRVDLLADVVSDQLLAVVEVDDHRPASVQLGLEGVRRQRAGERRERSRLDVIIVGRAVAQILRALGLHRRRSCCGLFCD